VNLKRLKNTGLEEGRGILSFLGHPPANANRSKKKDIGKVGWKDREREVLWQSVKSKVLDLFTPLLQKSTSSTF